MAKRVFLIHGWGGTPEGGWRLWLRDNLEKRGFSVSIPKMPETDHPKMRAWVDHLSKTVGEPDENCYFIGHSLGCTTILRYLETLGPDKKVGGSVLVAGPVERKNTDELQNFFTEPFEWEKIKSRCRKFIAIYSDNDSLVSLKNGVILEERLGAKLIVQHGMGHFSGAMDGVKELPIALDSVLELEKL